MGVQRVLNRTVIETEYLSGRTYLVLAGFIHAQSHERVAPRLPELADLRDCG